MPSAGLGGLFFSSHASVELAVQQTGKVKIDEHDRYGWSYHDERRDTFFTPALRLHLRPAGPVEIEPTVGFDVVRETYWSASSSDWSTLPPISSVVSDTSFGFSFGADLRIGSGRTAFVASLRLHRTFWPSRNEDYDLPRDWTVNPGAGVRLSF